MGSFNVRCRITDIPIEPGDPVIAIDITGLNEYFQEYLFSSFYKIKIYNGFYADYGLVRDGNKEFPIQERYDKNEIIFIHKEIWDEIQEWDEDIDYKKYEKAYEFNKKIIKFIPDDKSMSSIEDSLRFVKLVHFCNYAGVNLQVKGLIAGQKTFKEIYLKRSKMIAKIAKKKNE